MEINLETISVLHIQAKIKQGKYDLVWSFILDYENHINPSKENKISIQNWEKNSKYFCSFSNSVLKKSKKIENFGVHQRDALHISCAISCKCEFFITTDYNLLKKGKNIEELIIINPIDFVRIRSD